MATPEYAQWLARGRTHQWEGRPVDAMLCYRRALRAEPRAADPRFHLGEVLWQLGRIPAAVSAWREATEITPDHLAPQLALAEALLATGDAPAAAATAARALQLAPGQIRAELVESVAALTAAADAGDSARALMALQRIENILTRDVSLVRVAAVAGPLALALDRVPDSAERRALVTAIAAIAATNADAVAAMPALLVAQAVEHGGSGVRSIIDVAAARGYVHGDHEALRRIARAARIADPAAAATLAQLHSRICAQHFGAALPLLWPLRTAGAGCA